jgi:hypothetical protein
MNTDYQNKLDCFSYDWQEINISHFALNELDVLKDVSIKLEKSGIDYMLSGSFAMSYYAEPRMTRDLDIENE